MKSFKTSSVLIAFTISVLILGFTTYETLSSYQPEFVEVSAIELELFNLINNYRLEKGLEEIALSSSLTLVAKAHSQDLNDNYHPSKRCNLHSWSKKGKWSACCYTPNHKQAACMWNKPRELTDYEADGFEIAFAKYKSDGSDPELTAMEAFEGWKKSKGHHIVMVNKDSFKDIQWQAMGVGVSGGYACVWFGEEIDLSTK